jgi:hypothetical protein
LVEKKTGFDGKRTLIQLGFWAWCNEGSIFEQDISGCKVRRRMREHKSPGVCKAALQRSATTSAQGQSPALTSVGTSVPENKKRPALPGVP